LKHRKKKKVESLLSRLDDLIKQAKEWEAKYAEPLGNVHPLYESSAINLIHYRALRSNDIRNLQKGLRNMALSRFARAQSHVMNSLRMNKAILESLLKNKPVKWPRRTFSIKKSNNRLKDNAGDLLGYRSKGRRTRIMVTIPTEAAFEPDLVEEMISSGMNCARINCAHDDPEIWLHMIENIRKASEKLQKTVKISMDLAGPKIRTGALIPGPEVVRVQPTRDYWGNVIHPASVWLGVLPPEDDGYYFLPLAANQEGNGQVISPGDNLYFSDTRGRNRELRIIAVNENGILAECDTTVYFQSGHRLFFKSELEGESLAVGKLPEVEQRILLRPGDRIQIHRSPEPGEPAQYDETGSSIKTAHVSCTEPGIFDHVKPGESILFDDGKIRGQIVTTSGQELIAEIIHTKTGGAWLRADKGINFPESDLVLKGMTEKDKSDLAFVVRHADVVNVSFVNSVQDVRDIIQEIEHLDARNKIGVIFKIETEKGFEHLTEILLEGMRIYPIGVMIARGDLAVECGWNNIGRIQQEILSLCLAGHITEIWATQVFENLAKKGIPSRAEITDAVFAQRADCVMLNKGPYINGAIKLLDTILGDMEYYQDKNIATTPPLKFRS
jgi:pyruvate kinase